MITDFSTTPISKVVYIIGDPAVTSEQYLFTQTPSCGYDQTYTVTGLPTFATHQTAQRNFLVPQTLDLSLAGIYTVTVRADTSQPTDY